MAIRQTTLALGYLADLSRITGRETNSEDITAEFLRQIRLVFFQGGGVKRSDADLVKLCFQQHQGL